MVGVEGTSCCAALLKTTWLLTSCLAEETGVNTRHLSNPREGGDSLCQQGYSDKRVMHVEYI